MRDVHEIFSQTHREMQPLLTLEQRIKLEEMEKRHRRLLHRTRIYAAPVAATVAVERLIAVAPEELPLSSRNDAKNIKFVVWLRL